MMMMQTVRVSWDGADASAYDVMRHVFGWGRTGRGETLRALAAGVRASGFHLGSRTMPGGGKPTVTFAVASVHAFLVALQMAAQTVSESAATVAAYRCGPSVQWLVKHLANPAAPKVRKYDITSRAPLAARHCRIKPAPSAPRAHSASIDDVTRDTVRRCVDIILAALRTATNHNDAAGRDGAQTSATGASAQRAETDTQDADDFASASDRRFVERRTLLLATAARPLRVWCMGEHVGVRMCAVWPTAVGQRWGVSLPRSNGSIDFMGTIAQSAVVCMLARLLAVPGVVAAASTAWSSASGPTVGPEVRGAHALCALAGDADDNEADDPPLCCLSVFLPHRRPHPPLLCSEK
nr:hypothetical protein [Pandoravirus massiliensis]